MLIGLLGASILVFAAIRFPSFNLFILGSPAWSRFVIFTATIFPLATAYFRPHHRSSVFWIVMAGVFALHIIFFVTFMRYFRQLTSLDYIIYGPIEALIIAILFPRAMHFVHIRQMKKAPPITS
jgi:hypothetical protein